MPRYKCRVLGCWNQTSGIRANPGLQFFSFPEDAQLAAEWVSRCRQPKTFKWTSAKLCCVHFDQDAFDQNLGTKRMRTRQRCLKKDCLPTLFLPDETTIASVKLINGAEKGRKKAAPKIKQEPQEDNNWDIESQSSMKFTEEVRKPEGRAAVEKEKDAGDGNGFGEKRARIPNVKRGRYWVDVAGEIKGSPGIPKVVIKRARSVGAQTSHSASSSKATGFGNGKMEDNGFESEDSSSSEAGERQPRFCAPRRFKDRGIKSALAKSNDMNEKLAGALLNISYSNAKLAQAAEATTMFFTNPSAFSSRDQSSAQKISQKKKILKMWREGSKEELKKDIDTLFF